jgi:putative transposase
MPLHLKRYQQEGDDHFLTFSCHNREPYLNDPTSRTLFLEALETTRSKYKFQVLGYVVMPEHVHLLLSEPLEKPLASALQALKLSVSKRSKQRPFWLPRYHDKNVLTHNHRIDTLHYIHRNPVTRGLVANPEHWSWSSYRYFTLKEPGPVQITSLCDKQS